jgi:hypothetical protein
MKRGVILFLILFSYVTLNAQSYEQLKKNVYDKQRYFRQSLARTNNQDSVFREAQQYLFTIADVFFRFWYNTPWAFNGNSQTPGVGSIACGYFVTTTLNDMGFNIPRVKWAQQMAEDLIIKLTTDIKRFYNKPMDDVINYIKYKGEGLYIVGLDNHIGYIYYKEKEMAFVHSTYYNPASGVTSEPLIGQNPLNNSKYRVIGKIFDEIMVRNWIYNIEYDE